MNLNQLWVYRVAKFRKCKYKIFNKMNLFIIHQFPDLDNLAPIIKTLSTKKSINSIYLSRL